MKLAISGKFAHENMNDLDRVPSRLIKPTPVAVKAFHRLEFK